MKPFVDADETMTAELAQLADRIIAKHDRLHPVGGYPAGYSG